MITKATVMAAKTPLCPLNVWFRRSKVITLPFCRVYLASWFAAVFEMGNVVKFTSQALRRSMHSSSRRHRRLEAWMRALHVCFESTTCMDEKLRYLEWETILGMQTYSWSLLANASVRAFKVESICQWNGHEAVMGFRRGTVRKHWNQATKYAGTKLFLRYTLWNCGWRMHMQLTKYTKRIMCASFTLVCASYTVVEKAVIFYNTGKEASVWCSTEKTEVIASA